MEKRVIKIYPSVVIRYEGEETPVSLKWYEQNRDSLDFITYLLIIFYQDGSKEERYFDTYAAMLAAMQELYTSLKK